MINKIKIVEIFDSLQGEGKHLGKPVTFIRFWGCNLRCKFNGKHCDTPYAVVSGADKCDSYTPESLAKYLHHRDGPNHLVLTGGEPLMYQNFIFEFLKELYERNSKYYVEVETNGTIKPTLNISLLIDWFNISPKLVSSNQENVTYDNMRINEKALKSFLPHKSCYKFVYSSEEDSEEIKQIVSKHPKSAVYIMPEGTTRKQIIKNSPKVVGYCLVNDFIFSPREHIIIWDDKQGV
uniref:Radical SAM core domain-containing protein n=1 Tax=viral metagenome TaxID=1070528 RepID=A0A6C0EMW0_9ZZZZ